MEPVNDTFFDVDIQYGVSPINIGDGSKLTHRENGSLVLKCSKSPFKNGQDYFRVVVSEIEEFFEEGAGI